MGIRMKVRGAQNIDHDTMTTSHAHVSCKAQSMVSNPGKKVPEAPEM